MDLIPAGGRGRDDAGRAELEMSPAAMKLAEIMTAPVERRFVESAVRMVGKVEPDETRIAYIAPRVDGRIDRLYANYTGIKVKKGEHLADLYSPDLLAAQQQLIQAARSVRELQGGSASGLVASANSVLESAREKLRLWQLTPQQIAEIEQSGRPRDHITFLSPITGVVMEKMDTFEGMYVETGMRLFTVADLSRVWIKMAAYESDLAWLKYGQPVEFQVEAYPGETFAGRISFIAPVVDPETRTVEVRVNADNSDGRLKPEMFVKASIRAKLAADGRVITPDFFGKWISPMHPEVVKDSPGQCDVCGMPLVSAESLGYAGAGSSSAKAPLVIPSSAPLLTGERALVYVADPEREGVFEGREVILGPRAGGYYLVRSGLSESELVVVNGAFKIDSSLQIQGGSSMMQPAAEAEPARAKETGMSAKVKKAAAPESFNKAVPQLMGHYFKIAEALAADSFAEAVKAAGDAGNALESIDSTGLAGDAAEAWSNLRQGLRESIDGLKSASDLNGARTHFSKLSAAAAGLFESFEITGIEAYEIHCPMAFENKGASWLQKGKDVRNPYFGAAMLQCGSHVRTLGAGAAGGGQHDH
jgi:Cu(I)/Ag(I) efflux system membrane fusion protein